MRIPADLLAQVVDHALRDAPDECCGVLALRNGEAVAVHELENVRQGPKKLGFEVDGPQLARLLDEIEDAGDELGVIYHSHTVSAPYPSQTDVNFAAGWPGVEWLIIGTKGAASAEQAEVRSYLIDGATVTEVAVETVA